MLTMQRISDAKAGRMMERADLIFLGRANGHGKPIIRHLALRAYPYGLTELARRFPRSGKIADAWSADGLTYRAWRLGHFTAAQNLAMTYFNRRDMQGYRQWLRRAAQAGDGDAATSLHRFETRLSHETARDIGRGRPDLAHDGWWSDARIARRRAAMTGVKPAAP